MHINVHFFGYPVDPEYALIHSKLVTTRSQLRTAKPPVKPRKFVSSCWSPHCSCRGPICSTTTTGGQGASSTAPGTAGLGRAGQRRPRVARKRPAAECLDHVAMLCYVASMGELMPCCWGCSRVLPFLCAERT